MLEQLSNALPFRAFYTASGTGKTGLTVTVDVYNPAGTKIITAGSATEIGGGFYGYSLTSGNVTTEGLYLCLFKTTDTTVAQQHIAANWVVGTAGVENLDAAVSSRNATTPPTAAAIASATRTELATELGRITVSMSTLATPATVWSYAMPATPTAGTMAEHLDIAGSGGDPWAKTTTQLAAYDAGTAARLFNKLDVGAPETPVIAVPAPPADASMCTVYAYTESLIGAKRAGIVVTFKLSGKPGKSERILEAAAVTATTDADGMLSINLQRTDTLTPAGLYYLVTCRELGLSGVAMTLTSETYDLGGLIA